jgi:MoaA/NifB/PqqE/SkfB family radical SAM enzyme
MLTDFKRFVVLTLGVLKVFIVAVKKYRNISKAFKSCLRIFESRKKIFAFKSLPKYYWANGRFFTSPNMPGFPSKAWDRFIDSQLNLALPTAKGKMGLQTVVFSITSRCPLRCLHCFEWERLNGHEYLSLAELLQIQKKVENYGVTQIQYTGGEPMARINDLIELIKATSSKRDTWIFSSGYLFSMENALLLKKAGLTGLTLSLDHWSPEGLNYFRQSEHAFDWVKTAAWNAFQVNLALSLSICPTKAFVTKDNLIKYLDLAQQLHAGFIQILEPRRVGRYIDQEVELGIEQVNIITDFMLEVNNSKKYKKMPTIIFQGYHQRKVGCYGAGNLFMYIDSKGNAHACPFCQGSAGNCLNEDFSILMNKLKDNGCQKFQLLN